MARKAETVNEERIYTVVQLNQSDDCLEVDENQTLMEAQRIVKDYCVENDIGEDDELNNYTGDTIIAFKDGKQISISLEPGEIQVVLS